jgi:LacI family transcriptional regulator
MALNACTLTHAEFQLSAEEAALTIRDIAERAGVSIGTVDRVIHERGRVSSETAERIRSIVKDSDFKPNILARSLSLSRTFTFGVLMPRPEQDGGYWELAAGGISRAVSELSAFNVTSVPSFFDRYSEKSFREAAGSLLKRGCDGILAAPVLTTPAVDFMRNVPRTAPVVFFDSTIPETPAASFIGQDSFQSGILAGRLMHLLVGGAARTAAVRFASGGFHISERLRGFLQYFEKHRLPKPLILDQEHADDQRHAAALIDRFLDHDSDSQPKRPTGPRRPSGLFVTNASAHLFAAELEGRSRRRDLMLVGYDLVAKNVAQMKKGNIDFLISQRPEVQGYEGIYQLHRLVVLKTKIKEKVLMPLDMYTGENIRFHTFH